MQLDSPKKLDTSWGYFYSYTLRKTKLSRNTSVRTIKGGLDATTMMLAMIG